MNRAEEAGSRATLDERGGLKFVRLPGLTHIKGLTHAFLSRIGGVSAGPYAGLNLSWKVGDDPEKVRSNSEIVRQAFNIGEDRLFRVRQVHETKTVVVTPGLGAADVSTIEADALATGEPGCALAISTADCAPVILYDQSKKALAAVHAGWRGTALGAPAAALAKLTELNGTKPADVWAGVGPCVGQCCYEVDEAVEKGFREGGHPWEEIATPAGEGKWRLDIARANKLALLRAGIPEPQVETSGLCSVCREDLFFSYRRDGPESGRMLSLAFISPEPS